MRKAIMGLIRGAKETAKRAKAKKRKKAYDKSKKVQEVQTKPKKSLKNQKRDKTQKKPEDEIVGEYYAREFEKGEAARKAKAEARHPGRKNRRNSAYADKPKKAPIRGTAARRRAKKK